MLKVALIGPPQSGKTTLFQALTSGHSQTAKTHTGHIEIHRGIVKVPDERLFQLARLYQPKKISQVEIEYFDLVGTLESEKKQEGEKTAILRECDELLTVGNLFSAGADAKEALTLVQKELGKTLEDLSVMDYLLVEKRAERIQKQTKGALTSQHKWELELLKKCQKALEEQIPCREVSFTPEEERFSRSWGLLTKKPILIVLNVAEQAISRAAEIEKEFGSLALGPGSQALAACAEIELELTGLSDEERVLFQNDLGITQPASHRVAQASYQLMDLISFYTANQNEVKAWAIPKGTKALPAAGTVHSDMEKGFIKAEVINMKRLLEIGTLSQAREKGLVGLEGKEYIVQDGDVLFFRFNP